MRMSPPPWRILSSRDGWTPAFDAQFRDFYDRIFAKAFPDPDPRESLSRVRDLSDPRASPSHGSISASINAEA
jgi:hypothetical protein